MERVTVTLPTKNRPAFVFMCLSSLLSQSFQEWDLVIVDESDPPLPEYVELKFLVSLIQRYDHNVDIYQGEGLGIPQAWQRGLESSQSPFGQRLEDDVWLEPTYLQRLYDALTQDDTIAAVAGSNPNPFARNYTEPAELMHNVIIMQEPESGIHRLAPWLENGYVPIDGQATLADTDRVYSVCHLHGLFMYRADAVKDVGGFGFGKADQEGTRQMSRFGHRDETDLTLRLYFAGYDIQVCPAARLWHCEAPHGGSRENRNREACQNDEVMFQERLASWIKEHPDKLEEVVADIPPFGVRRILRRPV